MPDLGAHPTTTFPPTLKREGRACAPSTASQKGASALGVLPECGGSRRQRFTERRFHGFDTSQNWSRSSGKARTTGATAAGRRLAPVRRWPQGGEPWLTHAHHGPNATLSLTGFHAGHRGSANRHSLRHSVGASGPSPISSPVQRPDADHDGRRSLGWLAPNRRDFDRLGPTARHSQRPIGRGMSDRGGPR